MGTSASAADEWIELYNPGSQAIDLSGWVIEIAGDNALVLQGTIAAGDYYLIERTDDTAISDVTAHLTTSFGRYGLSNDGEELLLKNQQGSIIDRIGPSAWYAGSNSGKVSMERVGSAGFGTEASNWANNNGSITNGQDQKQQSVVGTPGRRNSVSH